MGTQSAGAGRERINPCLPVAGLTKCSNKSFCVRVHNSVVGVFLV